ncbi:MAG: protein-glutamate O-methyltransferase CheR [Firmicutes bacterium]|nr:protein-glutamate O-methyltransferase CheR [Bacillota bacterium]
MDYSMFKRKIVDILGIDLNSYKEQQMHRRILQWISRYDLGDYTALVDLIQKDEEHRKRFMEYLTINTSYFFRDTLVFDYLEKTLLPEIASTKPAKIWSAGCSIGAEVYSITILLLENKLKFNTLLATDIDETVLEKARQGIFQQTHINEISNDILSKYFTVTGNDYELKDLVRKHVIFKQHNLLTDPFPKGYDLILCRNVFIYFTAEVQRELTEKFVESLNPGGYFVVGSAEQIMNPAQFGLSRVSYCVYQKA